LLAAFPFDESNNAREKKKCGDLDQAKGERGDDIGVVQAWRVVAVHLPLRLRCNAFAMVELLSASWCVIPLNMLVCISMSDTVNINPSVPR